MTWNGLKIHLDSLFPLYEFNIYLFIKNPRYEIPKTPIAASFTSDISAEAMSLFTW